MITNESMRENIGFKNAQIYLYIKEKSKAHRDQNSLYTNTVQSLFQRRV